MYKKTGVKAGVTGFIVAKTVVIQIGRFFMIQA
jgi:hypothetical protein